MKKILQIKEIPNIPKLKPKKMSKQKRENSFNQNIVTRVILLIINAMKLNKITKKIKKLYIHLRGDKYTVKNKINVEENQSYTKLKKKLQNTLKELCIKNEVTSKSETSEFIKKRVDEIKELRVIDLGKF